MPHFRNVLGPSARQAGSLVSPGYLRFDFTHPQGMTEKEVTQVEKNVNDAIFSKMEVHSSERSREEAIAEGAMALFGEKYTDTVRTISIHQEDGSTAMERHSFELCGGTHIDNTSEIGIFLIISEGSAAAGITAN